MSDKQQAASATPAAAAATGAAGEGPASSGNGNGSSSNNNNSGPPKMAEYKKSQARVRELVEKRRLLEKRLVEDGIIQKETAYLESTPSGNIVTGFDNYLKGNTGAAAQRRKTGGMDQNRVFSRSSISYRPNNGDSTPGSTPGPSHAATPMSASFRDSGNATPTGGPNGKNAGKNKKKGDAAAAAAAAASAATEDSENDGQGNKKRTNFGASRK